jgi:hypothetical protein
VAQVDVVIPADGTCSCDPCAHLHE